MGTMFFDNIGPIGKPRFICVLDPLGLWAVWDEHTGQPAEAAVPLVGLSEAAARSACRDLNLRHFTEPLKASPPGRLGPRRILG
jgi:hypothetical protein